MYKIKCKEKIVSINKVKVIKFKIKKLRAAKTVLEVEKEEKTIKRQKKKKTLFLVHYISYVFSFIICIFVVTSFGL